MIRFDISQHIQECKEAQDIITRNEKELKRFVKGKTFRITKKMPNVSDGYNYLANEKRTCKIDYVKWDDYSGFVMSLKIFNKKTKQHDIWIRDFNRVEDLGLKIVLDKKEIDNGS